MADSIAFVQDASFAPKVNSMNARFTQLMYNAARRLFRDATAEFIRAAALGQPFGVDTGMSMASFIPLAQRISHAARVGPSKGLTKSIENAIQSRRKVPSRPKTGKDITGASYGKPYDWRTGVTVGKKGYTYDVGSQQSPLFNFTFSILVFQYDKWENEGYKIADLDYPPWQSLERGGDAFASFIDLFFEDYMTDERILRTLNPFTESRNF